MVGDGYCNDESNNIHCAFDGGDCCYSYGRSITFCKECKCLTGYSDEKINYALIGNGYCNDETNNVTSQYVEQKSNKHQKDIRNTSKAK